MSISLSVKNEVGKTWFSRLLFKIPGLNFLTIFPSLRSSINFKTSIAVRLLLSSFLAVLFVSCKRLKLLFNIPINMEHNEVKYIHSGRTALSSFSVAFTFYNRFSRLLQKINGWNFWPIFHSLCTIIRYKKSMVVWLLLSSFLAAFLFKTFKYITFKVSWL